MSAYHSCELWGLADHKYNRNVAKMIKIHKSPYGAMRSRSSIRHPPQHLWPTPEVNLCTSRPTSIRKVPPVQQTAPRNPRKWGAHTNTSCYATSDLGLQHDTLGNGKNVGKREEEASVHFANIKSAQRLQLEPVDKKCPRRCASTLPPLSGGATTRNSGMTACLIGWPWLVTKEG